MRDDLVRALLALSLGILACARTTPPYDTVIRNGMVYDGTGAAPREADVAIKGDSIIAIGPKLPGKGTSEIDAKGLAVAPGFINMLSHADESLIQDGRSQGDIRQGVHPRSDG